MRTLSHLAWIVVLNGSGANIFASDWNQPVRIKKLSRLRRYGIPAASIGIELLSSSRYQEKTEYIYLCSGSFPGLTNLKNQIMVSGFSNRFR